MNPPELKDAGMLKEWWAVPGFVGLMGFGTTTMLTGLHNVGWWAAGPTLAMAVAFGGTAQFVAGIVALRRGNFFGGSAFMGYGAFWWALFMLNVVLPKAFGIVSAAPEMAGFFSIWAMFTFSFCLCVHKHGKFLSLLFWMLFVAFLLLVATTLGKIPAVVTGWEIFATGFVAWYIATAELVNAETGKKILPLA